MEVFEEGKRERERERGVQGGRSSKGGERRIKNKKGRVEVRVGGRIDAHN